jgi:hypothetical protein
MASRWVSGSSGLAERAVAVVINAHEKTRHAGETNASEVVALWVQFLNVDWESAAAWHPIVGRT